MLAITAPELCGRIRPRTMSRGGKNSLTCCGWAGAFQVRISRNSLRSASDEAVSKRSAAPCPRTTRRRSSRPGRRSTTPLLRTGGACSITATGVHADLARRACSGWRAAGSEHGIPLAARPPSYGCRSRPRTRARARRLPTLAPRLRPRPKRMLGLRGVPRSLVGARARRVYRRRRLPVLDNRGHHRRDDPSRRESCRQSTQTARREQRYAIAELNRCSGTTRV